MAAKPLCSVDGCDNYVARLNTGLCYPHHYRLRRYGDPLAGRTLSGSAMRWIEDVALPFAGQGCLKWPFIRDGDGGAQFRLNGRTTRATRYVCERAHGSAPSTKHEAAHSCGKGHEGCINPGHLRWATHAENIADKSLHGTLPRGEANIRAKLTEDDVRWIVRMKGRIATADMAERLGVSQVTVQSILCGRNWNWLTKIRAA